jgi:hypothetical protein
MRLGLLACCLLVTPFVYGDPYLFLEDRGEPAGWPIPPGLHTYDLMVDTDNMDWSIAAMSIDIGVGEVWQHPGGWDGTPDPFGFDGESTAWDTFVTFPEAFPNTLSPYAFGFILSGSFSSATSGGEPIVWLDLTDNRDGPYVLSRLTVTEDFVGRIYGDTWFSDTGWQQYPFSLWIPEPGALAGLILLACIATGRARGLRAR